ncbi:Indoleamine 2,3-dioxygenase [Cristinia sonorae]|uniref:Indoleamine 2,3-dioxygenase n=1 Tax=Cristinia sonorae TaxID=1940300 RepID=A0A8K0XP02_9AGAR|nr:Indoleamine 2,3-dioxygenase [Cristinia sonorae]
MNVIPSPLHMLQRAHSAFDMKTIERALNLTRPGGFVPQHYDVDPHTGFFPPQPLPRLPATHAIWEDALLKAQKCLFLAENQSEQALAMRQQGECWRDAIRSWPVLSAVSFNSDIRLLQRAHLVLAWILHFYTHSIPRTYSNAPLLIPRSIAIPLVAVSRELGIAPVLTFADTVLWNWDLVDPEHPLSVENIRTQNTFSHTETESAFYTVSAAVELKGVEMLQIIEAYMNLPNVTERASVVKIGRDLIALAKIVKELTEIFNTIRGKIDPETFYWMCRPWWEGAEVKGSQPGWIYEGVANSASLDLGGPSAGQSSVMHALDLFLDIDHKLAQKRQPAPTETNKKAEQGFMERMRRYMPGKHREYLARVGAVPCSVREVARTTPCLQEPYNEVVAALKHLRDVHIRIACLYIVNQSTKAPPPESGVPASEVRKAADGHARGTGGNPTTVLLKAGRDATHRAMLMDG